nr:hypothetical protein Iba_scaffold923228CG0010 [Ipomoea batatas]
MASLTDLEAVKLGTSIAAPYTPMKKLEKMAIMMLPITTSGHIKIVKPAMGMHAVSKKGPSLLIRSCVNLYHPLKSMNGLFTMAIAV